MSSSAVHAVSAIPASTAFGEHDCPREGLICSSGLKHAVPASMHRHWWAGLIRRGTRAERKQRHLYFPSVQITMTPTLDTKLVNMPPHNFDPAEVPDADMCEFLGGSMGTAGTRRGSPGETGAAGPWCLVRPLSRTGSAGQAPLSRTAVSRTPQKDCAVGQAPLGQQ